MSGFLVFPSLEAALRAGFECYDRTTDGWLVRKRLPTGWALAIVALRDKPELRELDDSR